MAFFKIATVCAMIAFAACDSDEYDSGEQGGNHHHHPVGYSYAKFSGPVSGPEEKIFVNGHGHGADDSDDHDNGGHHNIDYRAKPDYHFSYGVEDPKSQVSQSRKESRDGDTVRGEYSVVDPDGTLRTVQYTADAINGFVAKIITSGGGKSAGIQHAPGPAPSHAEAYQHQNHQAPQHVANDRQSNEANEHDDEEDYYN